MESIANTVCVTGAAGYIGSWLVKLLLEQGYIVRATVRDHEIVSHLLELPLAETKLTLWKADLNEEGSFDEAIKGCAGVFHVATPMDFESKDPENEVIKPTVNGLLSIMKSCVNAKTVRRLVFTSSAGTVNVQEHQKAEYNETDWSDIEFCRAKKMTGWMYFVSKTLAEQAAWDYAKEQNIDFISILPTLVVGPFIVPTFPPSFITALSLITRNERHYSITAQGQFVHLNDLCQAQIHLYEYPKAKGRYICSAYNATIYEIAKLLSKMYPEYNVPQKFENIDEKIENVAFSSKKLKDTGFVFKYSLEDMFSGAIETCRAKGLLPMSFENEVKET